MASGRYTCSGDAECRADGQGCRSARTESGVSNRCGRRRAVGSGQYLDLSYVAERQQYGGRADLRWARDPEDQRSSLPHSLGRSAVWSSDAPLMTDVRDT